MMRALLFTIPLAIFLIGCGGVETKVHPAYAPIEPIEYPEQSEGVTPASLFTQQRGLSLFADTRARTDLSKGSEIGVESPVLFGEPFDFGGGGNYDLSQSIASEYGFQGQGSSNQSNRLQGAIAVQVAKVLPNGNLVVQGEKWIKLNQGDEFIQLRGIIRPEDISPLNTVPSSLVADARISYGGTGIIEEANTPGWLTRFFTSPLNPF